MTDTTVTGYQAAHRLDNRKIVTFGPVFTTEEEAFRFGRGFPKRFVGVQRVSLAEGANQSLFAE